MIAVIVRSIGNRKGEKGHNNGDKKKIKKNTDGNCTAVVIETENHTEHKDEKESNTGKCKEIQLSVKKRCHRIGLL